LAFTESTDWLPTAANSFGSMPGVRRSAAWRSSIGAPADVPARTWKPPPNSSTLLSALSNEPGAAVPVTSVKTTSVNIASVAPVRNRARKGYVIAIRATGASRPKRERTKLTARRMRSAL
jgi:hypothetical protein